MHTRLLTMFILLSCAAFPVQGKDRAVFADAGRSTSNLARGQSELDVYRFGLRQVFGKTFWTGDRARLSGYWEAAVNAWQGPGNNIVSISLSPVWTLSFRQGGDWSPYIEAGIGLALLSADEIGGRDLSTSWQFEDRVGFGIRGPRLDVHYRYMHYSNADLGKPNHGIDSHVIGVSLRF